VIQLDFVMVVQYCTNICHLNVVRSSYTTAPNFVSNLQQSSTCFDFRFPQ